MGGVLLYIEQVIQFAGYSVELELLTEASSAKAIASRSGVGRIRHIETRYLWLQSKIASGAFRVVKIPGNKNPADIGTKHVSQKDLEKLREMTGLRPWTAPDESCPA